MTDLHKAAEQALDALTLIDEAMPFPVAKHAITALREALAAPVVPASFTDEDMKASWLTGFKEAEFQFRGGTEKSGEFPAKTPLSVAPQAAPPKQPSVPPGYALVPVEPTQAPTEAAKDVLAERQRQISVEGWTPEHDDEHSFGELARAGAAYAAQSLCAEDAELDCGPPRWWPWDRSWWKPSGRRQMLVKAGALVLAEIERLDRAAPQPKDKP